MRKTFLLIMLAAVAICGWAANDNKVNDNTLKVKLDLVDFGDTVVVYRSGYEELTFVGKDGKFEFELQVETPCESFLLQPKILRGDMEDARVYSLPLVGGESVRVWDTERTRYDVDGTGFYADFHQMDLFNENVGKEQLDNAAKYRAMNTDNSISNEERSKFYNDVYSPSYNLYQQKLMDYVKAHPNQDATIFLLKNISGLDKKKEAYSYLDASVREGRMKPIYDKWIKEAEDNVRAEAEEKEAQKKQASGIEAPAFTLNDLEGKPLALSSLRGKYVILDFWGSWCV